MHRANRHNRDGERGFVMVMVLLTLAFGAAIIPATLNYVNTGRTSAGVSEEVMLRQYAADAAVEQSLWRLYHNVDGIVDDLSLQNPSDSFTTIVNGIQVPYTIEIAIFKDAEGGDGTELPPLPPIESGTHIETLLNVTPKWMPCGQEYNLTYDLYTRSYGNAAVHIGELAQSLPPGASYVDGSYAGPGATLTQTWMTDHWELLWEFENPRPRIMPVGTLLVSFNITITMGVGSFNDFGQGWVFYQASGQQEVQLNYGGTEDPIAVGLYDITSTAGSTQVQANASVCGSGSNLKSDQVQ